MSRKFLLTLPLLVLILFNGKKYEEAVIERLSVPVKVCVEGQNCGSAVQASQSAVTVASAAVKNCLLYTSPSPRDQRGSRIAA